MTPRAPNFARLRFSTRDVPPRDRIRFFREVLGRTALRLDAAPLRHHAFSSEVVLRTMPGLYFCSAVDSPMRVGRTRELLADGDDDVALCLPKTGLGGQPQPGGEGGLSVADAPLGFQ